MDYFKGQPCGQENCRERRFYIAEDGYTYCRRGHRTEAKAVAVEEDPELTYGRYSKKTRRISEETERPPGDDPHTSNALYLQCFQLVLWKQVHWLIHSQGYPAELERVVKDIWALRIQSIQQMLVEEEEDDNRKKSFSSRLDASDDDDPNRTRLTKTRFSKLPQISESLVLCYFGLILLRVPVSLSDVRKWCLSNDFVYIQAGSGSALPTALFKRVPASLRQRLLVLKGLPDPGELANLSLALTVFYHRTFGLVPPPFRETPILFRLLSTLALPLDVYQGVKAITAILRQSFDFVKERDYKYIADHPELKLLSLVILTVKLFYPFSSAIRSPRDAGEPSSAVIDWTAWNSAFSQSEPEGVPSQSQRSTEYESEQAVNERAMKTTEVDVYYMNGDQIDEYLDWFQRQWISEDTEEHGREADFRRKMYELFPLKKPSRRSERSETENDAKNRVLKERLQVVHDGMIKRAPNARREEDRKLGGEHLRPGDEYEIYRDASELPENARCFFGKCAQMADISVDQMVFAVYRAEMGVQKWMKASRASKHTSADETQETAKMDATDVADTESDSDIQML